MTLSRLSGPSAGPVLSLYNGRPREGCTEATQLASGSWPQIPAGRSGGHMGALVLEGV